jgi:urease alpha subunit
MQDTDDLIRYLAKARDAYDHTVDEVTELVQPSAHFSVGGKMDGWQSFHIKKMTADRIEYSTNSPDNVTIKFVPANVLAKPAITRGVTYPVPTAHGGKQLSDTSLLNFATLGLSFYGEFIEGMAAEGWDSDAK